MVSLSGYLSKILEIALTDMCFRSPYTATLSRHVFRSQKTKRSLKIEQEMSIPWEYISKRKVLLKNRSHRDPSGAPIIFL